MAIAHIRAGELLEQFQVTEADLQLIHEFSKRPEVDVKNLIEDFYIWLRDKAWYQQYFAEGVPPRVKSLQQQYWEGFLDAQVDDAYVNQRIVVGRVHATINLPVTAYLAGMNFAQMWFSELAKRIIGKAEHCITLLGALNRLIQLDTNIVMHIYASQSMDAIRQQGERTKKIVGEVTRVVTAAATGDFNTTYQRLDDSDELERPINQMVSNLKRFSRENEKEQWLKSGIADLAVAMRGGLCVNELSDNVIRFLAEYLGAQIGVLYVSREDGSVSLSASYAYTRRKNLSTTIRPGEGLVGQALKERKAILISNVPRDYITVNSGLGEHPPGNIIVHPLIYEQSVKGLVELGAFPAFTDDHLEFLRQVGETIAVSINSAQDQEKMQHLLAEAQQTSEELQAQQEELRAANETLEEQAQALRQSEEELTAQKDMLEASNRELQLKTRDLEQQKTEIERARSELQEKAEQLATTSKYKSEFLANMSHELRTPLNSLLLLSQSLTANKKGNLTAEQIEDLKVIYSGGSSLLTLINDILDLSKVEAGKLRITIDKVDLDALCGKLRNQFRPVAEEKGLKFDVTVNQGTDTDIYTDEQRLEQIIRNLLSNAFKFTHKGEVTLTISNPGKETDINTSGLTPDTRIAFNVSDTGIGIAAARQAVIFEAFQQVDGSTSRAYGGTGLGLTISRELAKLLGGEIHLHSIEGEGSRFTLYIPKRLQRLTHPAAAHAPQSGVTNTNILDCTTLDGTTLDCTTLNGTTLNCTTAETALPSAGRSDHEDRYVLIVEDDPQFAKILSELAEKRGFRSLVTDQGRDALKLVLSHTPKAVILDMGLPDTDGLQVLESLKASPDTRNIPVHIISSRDEDLQALKKGALGFLTKPVSLEELEKVFARFETLIQKNIKHLLLIEADKGTCEAIHQYLQNKEVQIHTAPSGAQALQLMQQQRMDCCILDFSLPDMHGFDFLAGVEQDVSMNMPPVIVYADKELPESDYKKLMSYTDKIVIKDGQSPERLQEEVELFLHSVEDKLPPSPRHRPDAKGGLKMGELKGRKVLLVDDDLRNVYALSKVLKEHGLKVTLADNGKLAVEKLQMEVDVDLILMDIMMPVMDGYEAMKQIRGNISTSIPIIALTAKAMVEDREKCIAAGANDYMAKPVDVNNLLSMVKVWLYH